MNKSTSILVAISLAVNVLLIGVIMGHLSHRSHQGYWGKEQGKHRCHGSRPGQDSTQGKFAGLFEKKHEMFKQLGPARREVFKVLTADKFDPVLYKQKSQALHQAYAQIATNMSADIEKTATGLAQADRIELAKELKHMRHHKKPGCHKH